MIEYRKPIQMKDESDLEFTDRQIDEQLTYRRELLREMNKTNRGITYKPYSTVDGLKEIPNTVNGRYQARKKTFQDWIQDRDIALEIYRNNGRLFD